MSKLIFLSWAFPPMLYPRAMQIGRLAKYLGRPVHVYCAGNQPTENFDVNITVTQIEDTPGGNLKERLVDKLCPALLRRPDLHRWWALRAARAILKNENLTSEDTLVTFSQPHSDHLAGLKIRQKTGVKWAAYFSDPFTDNPFDPHAKRAFAKKMESDVINSTDLLLFSSQETIDLVMEKYPASLRSKTRILEHSYAEEHDRIKSSETKPKGLLIRHLGNLYQERSPLPFLDVLADIHKENPDLLTGVTFDFVGHLQMREEVEKLCMNLPDGLITTQEPVPYARSLELMHEADYLLLIEAPFDQSPFLPSKLVEYIGAGKPVIALTPDGTGARVTRETGGFVANIRDAQAMKKMIENILKSKDISNSLANNAKERFSPHHIANELNCILKEIE